MTEPAGYRARGPGDDARRHSSHKRTRGEDDYDEYDDAKYARRRYEDDERSMSDRRSDRPRRRSLSPRDHDGAQREKSHRGRDDAYRRDERPRGFDRDRDNDYASQSKREERKLSSRSNQRPRAPSPSTRHQHSHSHHHHHHHRHHRRSSSIQHSTNTNTSTPAELPFGSRRLVRSDLENFRPLLAQYLEVQKQKDITALDEREVRGRWKSFVTKWNKGELAEGWYRAETLEEARREWAGALAERRAASRPPPVLHNGGEEGREGPGGGGSATRYGEEGEGDGSGGSDEDDEYGPILPPGAASDAARSARHGPGIPSMQDLAMRREDAEEERLQDIDQLRLARKADRAEQRERLEDLVPRAAAGTRERRLEKKQEVNDKMRSFRNRSPGGVGEVGEAELMGSGGGDEVAEYKRAQEAARRKRSEREVRREEEARARAAEREVRIEEYRRKEESTMEVLRQIARERFG
ncbi:hypothetical protein GGR53DRAFT_165642 [Hypoxylon sp. FL1150]|nr:hypothetical protein GGR53DRAFT_165642 [Hypoxylon sp. FL1150]